MAKARASTKSKSAKAVVKLPSIWQLHKKSFFEYLTFWRSFVGILIVYAVLYFILVLGFSFSSNIQSSGANSSSLSRAFNAVFSVFSSSSSSNAQSSATVLLQFLLFVVASMAFVWALRKLQALKKIKIRDAYYQGTSALIPTILVIIVLMLTLLPAIGGSAVLSVALQTATTGAEISIVSLIAGLLLILSIYLFAMLWPSFYIVSLPATRPFGALKIGRQSYQKTSPGNYFKYASTCSSNVCAAICHIASSRLSGIGNCAGNGFCFTVYHLRLLPCLLVFAI